MSSALSDQVVTEHGTLFIGGEWREPNSRETITVVSPNSGEEIGSVPLANRADIDEAVAAARAAFDDPSVWSGLDPAERAAHLRRFADELSARGEQIASLVSSQNGMPVTIAGQMEAVYPATLLRYYADLIEAQTPTCGRA